MFTRSSDPTETKVAWMNCHWLRDVRGELDLWNHLEAFTSLRCIQPLALRWWGYYAGGHVFRQIEGPRLGRYRKVLAVLKHIESEANRGSVTSFLSAVERFAMHSEGAWLKVAGGQKAEVLEWLVDRFRNSSGNAKAEIGGYAAIECGAFIGYTSSRLGERLRLRDDSAHTIPMVSIECDPVHVVIARHFIDFVRLANDVEVFPGMVRDVFPALIETFGWSAIGFTFMDQKGTSFHDDFALFQALQSLHPGAEVVADNALRPGAPVFIWQLAKTDYGAESTKFWSLPEFLEESMGVEDWMAAARVLKAP